MLIANCLQWNLFITTILIERSVCCGEYFEGFLKGIFPVEVAILYNKSLLYFVKFYFKKEFHLLKTFVLFDLPGHSIKMDYKTLKTKYHI